jgi:hypothetical protein
MCDQDFVGLGLRSCDRRAAGVAGVLVIVRNAAGGRRAVRRQERVGGIAAGGSDEVEPEVAMVRVLGDGLCRIIGGDVGAGTGSPDEVLRGRGSTESAATIRTCIQPPSARPSVPRLLIPTPAAHEELTFEVSRHDAAADARARQERDIDVAIVLRLHVSPDQNNVNRPPLSVSERESQPYLPSRGETVTFLPVEFG